MKSLVLPALLGTLVALAAADPIARPFAFFEPTIRVSAADRDSLDRGDVIARVLPADDGYVTFFAAARLKARPEALIAWTRAIEQLKRGPMVLAVGRLSDPVADDDLDALVLEKSEVDDLKRCRVGNCDFKLAAGEIAAIEEAIRLAGPDWREAAQRAFRRILVARVRLHARSGLLALPPYADHGGRMSVGEAFSAMAARSPYLTRAFPEVINALLAPRHASLPHGEGFYYWSRERFGSGKTVVTITYVQLLSNGPAPQAMSVSTQLYASHYLDGALGLTAVFCDETAVPQRSFAGVSSCYVAYVNRTRVDLLGGLLGGFKRAVIEDRIESEGPRVMREATRRMESVPIGAGGES